MDNETKRNIEIMIQQQIGLYLKNQGFTARKVTDTPTDDLQVVNRKYVNLNGSIAGAPKSSIIGQQFFASDLGYPVYKHQNGRWVNSVGSVVG